MRRRRGFRHVNLLPTSFFSFLCTFLTQYIIFNKDVFFYSMILNCFAPDYQHTQNNYSRFLHIVLSLAQSNTPSLLLLLSFSSSKHTYRLQTHGLPVCLAEDLVIYSQAERKKRGRSVRGFEGAGLAGVGRTAGPGRKRSLRVGIDLLH